MSFMKLLVFLCFLLGPTIGRAEQIVAYVTDLEGSRQRFEQFMRQSEAFELGSDGKFHLRKDAHFVFGGDAPDRYLGSQWVVSELVRLKRETPERVALILGNRDINKMRLTAELSSAALLKPPIKFHFTKEEEWAKHVGPESRADRLKYILASTMGAPLAFELRRKEIAGERKVIESTVADEVVAESYLHELQLGGAFREFLELGQLAHRIGNTLFVHGGVTTENLGFIPGDPRKKADVDEWIADLNHWMYEGVKTWKKHSSVDWSGEGSRPEQAWLDYPMPKPGANSRPDSVVTGRNSDALNNPHLPERSIIAELLGQGIDRIVIGHTPTGDYPLILRTEDERFEVVSADNSFTKNEAFAALVHFKGDGMRRTVVRGMFTIGGEALEAHSDIILGQATPIGKRTSSGGFLLGRLVRDPGSLISFQYGKNFRIVAELVQEKDQSAAKALEPLTTAKGCAELLIPKQGTPAIKE